MGHRSNDLRIDDNQSRYVQRVIAKSGLMAYGLMALWPYGLRFFLLLLLITQRHYSHPGSTGSMQAAKVRKLLIDCIL